MEARKLQWFWWNFTSCRTAHGSGRQHRSFILPSLSFCLPPLQPITANTGKVSRAGKDGMSSMCHFLLIQKCVFLNLNTHQSVTNTYLCYKRWLSVGRIAISCTHQSQIRFLINPAWINFNLILCKQCLITVAADLTKELEVLFPKPNTAQISQLNQGLSTDLDLLRVQFGIQLYNQFFVV